VRSIAPPRLKNRVDLDHSIHTCLAAHMNLAVPNDGNHLQGSNHDRRIEQTLDVSLSRIH
jgi:hypothetical protein